MLFLRVRSRKQISDSAVAVITLARRYTSSLIFNLVGSFKPSMQEIMQFVGRHPILSIAWIALLAAVLYTTFKGLTSKVKTISRGEATHLINKENAVVVDIRQRDDFRKGHIASAMNVLPSDIKSGNLGELDKLKTSPIILVDASGMSASESAAALYKAGFERVAVLKEGIAGWSGENLPLVRGK